MENKTINRISSADEAEIDRSLSKILFLAVCGAVSASLYGYFLKLFILSGEFVYFAISFAAAVGFGAVFLVNSIFIKSLGRANLIIFFECLALAAGALFAPALSADRPFSGLAAGFSEKITQAAPLFGAAALAVFLLLVSGNYGGYSELQNSLKVKFWRVSRAVLPKAILSLIIFGTAVYAGNFSGPSADKFFVSEQAFEKTITVSAAPFIQKFLPEFDLSLSVQDLIAKMAENQVERNPQFKILPNYLKKQLVNQATADLEARTLELAGSPVDFQKNLSRSIYGVLVFKFNQLTSRAKTVVAAIVAVLLFLTAIGFAWPVRILMTIGALVIYETFLALGFAMVALEGRNREIVILK